MSDQLTETAPGAEALFAYLELLKVEKDPLLPALEAQSGDGYVFFNPAHQAGFVEALSAETRPIVAGRFSAAHKDAREAIAPRRFFTVLQDPIVRFFESYREARDTPVHGLHDLYNTISPEQAAQYCIDNNLDGGKNSQCSAIIQDSSAPSFDFETALEACQNRFDFVCTTAQMGQLVEYLQKNGLVPSRKSFRLPLKERRIRQADRRKLDAILAEATSQDQKLFDYVNKFGPLQR